MHKDENLRIFASGRTDAGVHAIGQVIHFDTHLTIATDTFKKALNVQLPYDIRVMNVEEVEEDFHARFHAKRKRYRYIWDCAEVKSPFRRNYAVFADRKPDVQKMQEGAKYLIGTHDFTSFRATGSSVQSSTRTIYASKLVYRDAEIILDIHGNGFLYNMVRIIMGTLVEIGMGKIHYGEIPRIIQARDRNMAGITAPAQGLYLEKVYYKNS